MAPIFGIIRFLASNGIVKELLELFLKYAPGFWKRMKSKNRWKTVHAIEWVAWILAAWMALHAVKGGIQMVTHPFDTVARVLGLKHDSKPVPGQGSDVRDREYRSAAQEEAEARYLNDVLNGKPNAKKPHVWRFMLVPMGGLSVGSGHPYQAEAGVWWFEKNRHILGSLAGAFAVSPIRYGHKVPWKPLDNLVGTIGPEFAYADIRAGKWQPGFAVGINVLLGRSGK